jgi:hypothetical protein
MNNIIQNIENQLLISNAKQRLIWANKIVESRISLKELYPILIKDNSTSMRCLWLLGDIADISSEYLFNYLEELFQVCSGMKQVEIQASFAKFWALCGIPVNQESMCIDLLLKWIASPTINVTTKSRSLLAIKTMINKYPDIKQECLVIIQNQCDNHSKDFKKRCEKMIHELNMIPLQSND